MIWFSGGHRPPAFSLIALALWAFATPAPAQDADGAPRLRGSGGSPAGSAIPAYQNQAGSVAQAPIYESWTLAPNYGHPRKPRERRAGFSGRRPIAARDLPPLEAYRTAPQSPHAANAAATASAGPPGPTVAVTPGPAPRRRPRVEDDPYGPVGLRFGGLQVTPYVGAQAGYDSNPERVRNGKGSPAVRGEAGFSAGSDWSRHALSAQASASYVRYTSLPDASRPEVSGEAALRLDVQRDTFANFQLRGSLSTQRQESPEVPGATLNRPAVGSFSLESGLSQRLGRLEAGFSFLVGRTMYGDAQLSGGGVERLSRGNYNSYGLQGRLSHELAPGVRPFIEVSADRRRRDEPVDALGFARDSTGFQARAGSTFELTRSLTGEAGAGYGSRRYEDSRLPILAGPVIDARLIWSATPLTTLTVRAATEFGETTIANASGFLSRRASLDVAHALLRNFTLGAGVAFTDSDYRGVSLSEQTVTASLRADYNVNRNLALRGSFAHERLWSSQAGSGYGAQVFLLGLRLQP